MLLAVSWFCSFMLSVCGVLGCWGVGPRAGSSSGFRFGVGGWVPRGFMARLPRIPQLYGPRVRLYRGGVLGLGFF